ncbi:hypothetical protein DBR06_SOUSAS22610057, partial [Sousa chinensis]
MVQGAEQLKGQTSDRLETVILDVAKTESITAATKWVKEHARDRGVWGLVNKADISMPTAPNEWLTKQNFMKILDVNLLGVIEVTLSLLSLVRKARGRDVNISSVEPGVSLWWELLHVQGRALYFGVKIIMIKPGQDRYVHPPVSTLARLEFHPSLPVSVPCKAMWLYLAVLVGLYYLLRWYRERQVVSLLQDKFVFITGCDSGFGNLLARQLDLRGLRVLATCLTEQGAEQLNGQTSDRLETVILDVTKTESIAAAAEWVKERVGDRGLWGLVNNAGICTPMAPNEWLTKQDFVKMLDVNLLGMIEVTLSLLPLVRKARGRVVNVSSVMGRVSLFGGGYCMSKYGVEAFSDSLRRELSYFGVKVAMIEPGYFMTNMTSPEVFNGSLQASWDQASPEIKELYGEKFVADFMKTSNLLKPSWSGNLSLMTNCMEHALTSCHPRTRYSAGWDAKFFYLPVSYMPTFLVDLMMYWGAPRPAKALKELSYFGVKEEMIVPGYFKTFVTSPEAISRGLQAAWDQASS